VTITYSAECKVAQKANRPAAMLPILVVLFVISYCLLTLLVFEQGQTIESQRTLIRAMLQDSNQLAALKMQIAENQRQHNQAAPSDKKNGAPSAAAPQGSDKGSKQPRRPSTTLKRAPGKPQSDLEDVRRATHTI